MIKEACNVEDIILTRRAQRSHTTAVEQGGTASEKASHLQHRQYAYKRGRGGPHRRDNNSVQQQCSRQNCRQSKQTCRRAKHNTQCLVKRPAAKHMTRAGQYRACMNRKTFRGEQEAAWIIMASSEEANTAAPGTQASQNQTLFAGKDRHMQTTREQASLQA